MRGGASLWRTPTESTVLDDGGAYVLRCVLDGAKSGCLNYFGLAFAKLDTGLLCMQCIADVDLCAMSCTVEYTPKQPDC